MPRVKLRIEALLSAISLNLVSGSVLMRTRLAKHAAGSVLNDLAARNKPGSDNSDFLVYGGHTSQHGAGSVLSGFLKIQ